MSGVASLTWEAEKMTGMLDLVNAGQANVDRLDDPDELKRAAELVFEFADKRSANMLIPASDAAERILGAILMMHGRGVGTAVDSRTAVVFDVNMASGTSIAKAARRARDRGADHVHAIVLHGLATAEGFDNGLDELLFIDSRDLAEVSEISSTTSGL